ncbi:MAG: PmoA family protein [Bacteroidales bacterium]
MKTMSFFTTLTIWLLVFFCNSQTIKQSSIDFIIREDERKVDVIADGKLLTSYCWPENVYKPILYPLYSAGGVEVTRGFPLHPREGERNDHIHQVGLWLNYGNVNGYDFWGNGSRGYKEPHGGEIKHTGIVKAEGGNEEGILIYTASWLLPSGYEILSERTEYHFIARGNLRIIDRITTLTANDSIVALPDTKEGMFGIRVARQLELPVNEMVTLLDETGKPSDKKVKASEGATGNYRSSTGITGEKVWGSRAEWMLLYGTIGEEKISLVVCDHPDNPGFPTYWHARGYGLFAANPFGWKDFTSGKEQLNYSMKPHQQITFRYRVIINSESFLNDKEINDLAAEFKNKY